MRLRRADPCAGAFHVIESSRVIGSTVATQGRASFLDVGGAGVRDRGATGSDEYARRMTYLDVLGHPTWVVDTGHAGALPGAPPIVMLHGGLSNSDELDDLGDVMRPTHRVVAFDRRGHGRTADTIDAFHFGSMVDETVAVIEHLGTPAHLVGWSDGGIVSLLVALRRPDLVARVVLIGVNYHHEGARPFNGGGDGMFASLAASYGERSPNGPEHFEEVVTKTLTLWGSEPTLTTADLNEVSVPVLVLVGDDDIIELSHTVTMYESIPGAQLSVVPAASHALPLEQPEETGQIILRFLTMDLPVDTIMPSRRAT